MSRALPIVRRTPAPTTATRPWYAEHDVDLRLGARVTGLDPAAHQVTLAEGGRLGYAKLLLATGSSPRLLPVPDADAHGVSYLRRVDDSDQIRWR